MSHFLCWRVGPWAGVCVRERGVSGSSVSGCELSGPVKPQSVRVLDSNRNNVLKAPKLYFIKLKAILVKREESPTIPLCTLSLDFSESHVLRLINSRRLRCHWERDDCVW